MDLEQGKITKIHDFQMNFDFMKNRLNALKEKYPSGVIIPVKGNDFSSPAFSQIIKELNKCDYLKKVYIAFSGEPEEHAKAHQVLTTLETPHELLWCNKPQVQEILQHLKKRGLDVITNCKGKGRDVWIAIGIASLELHALAIHDADIITYSNMIPTKLLFSIVEPSLDFWFCKGYYARVNLENRRMYGRIYRLFINPVLDALQEKMSYSSSFIRYLQSFRYPLSGEVAIYTDLALNLRFSGDWGFEVGMLAELFRNVSNKRVCEMDLGFFDHKHNEMSQDGLLKTSDNSFITLLRTLTETDGIDVSEPFLLSLQVMYRRIAQDKIRQYYSDAFCNNLQFDRHEEETNLDYLSKVIMKAGRRYINHPTTAQLPDWLRTISAMPDAREKLRKAAIDH